MARILFVLNERWDSALTYYASGVLSAARRQHETLITCFKGSYTDKHLPGLRYHLSVNPSGSWSLFAEIRKITAAFKPHIVVTIKGDATLFAHMARIGKHMKIMRIFGEDKRLKTPDVCMDRIILPCELLKERLTGKASSKSVTIKGFVNRKLFRFDPEGRRWWRNRLGIKEKELLFGAVGRLDPVKGYKLLIKAFAESKISAKLLIAGEEKNLKASDLINTARRAGVEEKMILLPYRVVNIASLMSAFDAGVISSLSSEIIARVAFEFLSVGLPIVSTDVGMLSEIMKPCFSEIASPSIDSLKRALENMASRDLHKSSLAAFKEAEAYGKETFEKRQLNEIERLLSQAL